MSCDVRPAPKSVTYEIQNGDFHFALIQVGRFVLDDFDSDDIMRPHVLALDNLSKRALTQNIKNEVPRVSSMTLKGSLVTPVGTSQNVIDIENVVVVFIVVAFVVLGLARLGEHSARIEV